MEFIEKGIEHVKSMPWWAKGLMAAGGLLALKSAVGSMYARRRLDSKTILITGAASGIGALMAKKFSKIGASLVLWDLARSRDALQALKEEIEGSLSSVPADKRPSVRIACVDVTDREGVEKEVSTFVHVLSRGSIRSAVLVRN